MFPFSSYAEYLGTIVLTLFVGPKRKEISVHRNPLASRTKYFEEKLSKNAEGDYKIYLADEDPEAFAILVEWLYKGNIEEISVPVPAIALDIPVPAPVPTPVPVLTPATSPNASPVQFSSFGTPLASQGLGNKGTLAPFSALVEKEPNNSTGQQNCFQSLCLQKKYLKFSPEELRVVDYQQARRYAAGTTTQAGPSQHAVGFANPSSASTLPSTPFGDGSSAARPASLFGASSSSLLGAAISNSHTTHTQVPFGQSLFGSASLNSHTTPSQGSFSGFGSALASSQTRSSQSYVGQDSFSFFPSNSHTMPSQPSFGGFGSATSKSHIAQSLNPFGGSGSVQSKPHTTEPSFSFGNSSNNGRGSAAVNTNASSRASSLFGGQINATPQVSTPASSGLFGQEKAGETSGAIFGLSTPVVIEKPQETEAGGLFGNNALFQANAPDNVTKSSEQHNSEEDDDEGYSEDNEDNEDDDEGYSENNEDNEDDEHNEEEEDQQQQVPNRTVTTFLPEQPDSTSSTPQPTPTSSPPEPQPSTQNTRQLALLNLTLFAEKAIWPILFNTTIDVYIKGEDILKRKIPVEHVTLIYKTHRSDSTLRKLRKYVIDNLADRKRVGDIKDYAPLMKELDGFGDDVLRRWAGGSEDGSSLLVFDDVLWKYHMAEGLEDKV